MNNLSIGSGIKLITIIALAAVFMTSMTNTPAEADSDECPCDFVSAIRLAHQQAQQIQGGLFFDECDLEVNDPNPTGITLEGGEQGDSCRVEIESEFQTEGGDHFECGWEIQCPPEFTADDIQCEGEVDVETGVLVSAYDQVISDEDHEECFELIEFIAKRVGVECVVDEP